MSFNHVITSIKKNLLPLGLYIIITIFMFFLLNPIDITKTYFGMSEVVAWSNYFFWYEHAIFNYMNPLHYQLLFYPLEFYKPDVFFPMLLFVPITHIFGSVTSYNLYVLLTFILSGFGMFLLSNYFLKDRYIAFITGIIFAFFPFHFGAAMGHIHTFSIMWIPFFILFFFKMWEENEFKNIFFASFFFSLNALTSWTIAVMLCTFCFLFMVFFWNEYPILKSIKKIIMFSMFSIVLISPALYIMVKSINQNKNMVIETYNDFSADFLSFFTPSPLHPFFGPFTSQFYNKFVGNFSENIVFIGYTVLILAIIGVLKGKKDRTLKLFILNALIFFLLALGPNLHILGNYIFTSSNISIPLFGFMNSIPIFNIIRVPSRYDIMVMFFISLIAGYGLEYLFKKVQGLNFVGFKKCFCFLIIMFILFEYLAVIPVLDVQNTPISYYSLQNDTADPILEIPIIRSPIETGLFGIDPMIRYYEYQKIHKHPIMGGYFNRVNPLYENFIRKDPVLKSLFYGSKVYAPYNEFNPSLYLRINYNISYIIIHKNLITQKNLNLFTAYLGNNYSEDNSNDTDNLIIYNLTEASNVTTKNPDLKERYYNIYKALNTYTLGHEINGSIYGDLSQYIIEGWSYPEPYYTWTNDHKASLSLVLNTIPIYCVLEVNGFSFTGPNHDDQLVNILINKKIIGTINFAKFSKIHTISIPPGSLVNGTNTITFDISNPVSPKEIGMSEDRRKLGIAVKSIKIRELNDYSRKGNSIKNTEEKLSQNLYEIGSIILFSEGGNSNNYKTTGWSYPEPNITWTDGYNSSLSLFLNTVPHSCVLEINGSSFTDPNQEVKPVNILINEKNIGTINFDKFLKNHTISIPSGYLINGTNTIAFDIFNPISPKELGISEDPRKLGIAVKSIQICDSNDYSGKVNPIKITDEKLSQNLYEIGSLILFSDGGNSNKYKTSGWSYQEPNITWTDGYNSSLSLFLNTVPHSCVLEINGSSFINPLDDEQSVKIFINDNIIGTEIFDKILKIHTISIPPGYLINGTNTITFDISNPISPKDVGISEDPRKLGIAVKSLKIYDSDSLK